MRGLQLPGQGDEREVVEGDQLAGHSVLRPHELLTDELEVLVPNNPGRGEASRHLAGQVDVTALLVRSSEDIPHCPGIVQYLWPARPHYHCQLDSLRPSLRCCEVHPTPGQTKGISKHTN